MDDRLKASIMTEMLHEYDDSGRDQDVLNKIMMFYLEEVSQEPEILHDIYAMIKELGGRGFINYIIKKEMRDDEYDF